MKTIAFFNNKGGVGKTSLVFHLAWSLRNQGHRVIVADLDPQANATTFFLGEELLVEMAQKTTGVPTIFKAFAPLLEGTGDLAAVDTVELAEGLHLIPGDLALSGAESELSAQWLQCSSAETLAKKRAFRTVCGFYRAIDRAARDTHSDIALLDVGPNLGPLNRTALVASDFVVIPLASDAFSLQGLKNAGPALKSWREEWHAKRDAAPSGLDFDTPKGEMKPLGYVLSRFSLRAGRPAHAFQYWSAQVPAAYRKSVLGESENGTLSPQQDTNCLAELKDYRSLMPMAQSINKPIFALTAADGAIGAHQAGVWEAKRNFDDLANRIMERI